MAKILFLFESLCFRNRKLGFVKCIGILEIRKLIVIRRPPATKNLLLTAYGIKALKKP